MLENLILIGHLIAAIAIIALILLQQGKGAEMGASFGAGASQTLFGSSGSGNFFAKATAVLAAIFFATSLTLAVVAKRSTAIDDDLGLPALEEIDLPVVEEQLGDSELPSLSEGDDFPTAAESAIDSMSEKAHDAMDTMGEKADAMMEKVEEELPEVVEEEK